MVFYMEEPFGTGTGHLPDHLCGSGDFPVMSVLGLPRLPLR